MYQSKFKFKFPIHRDKHFRLDVGVKIWRTFADKNN